MVETEIEKSTNFILTEANDAYSSVQQINVTDDSTIVPSPPRDLIVTDANQAYVSCMVHNIYEECDEAQENPDPTISTNTKHGIWL